MFFLRLALAMSSISVRRGLDDFFGIPHQIERLTLSQPPKTPDTLWVGL